MVKFQVGDRVRLTGKFLRSTGQQVGRAGLDVWTVTALQGSFAVTNEPLSAELLARLYTVDEVAADPTLRFHRVNVANLQKVGR